MAAEVLSKKDQSHTLGGKTRRLTVKNVVCSPYISRWPPVEKQTEEDIFSKIKKVFTEVEMTKVGLRTNRSRNKKEQDDHVIQEGKSADIENNIASVGPELLNLRSQLIVGNNHVTRKLEKGMLRLVIVERNAEDILHRHLYRASAIRGVAALALTGLKERICSLFNFQRPVLALGFKVLEDGDSKLFDSLVEFIAACSPQASLEWETDIINDSGIDKDDISEDNIADHDGSAVMQDYSHLYVHKPAKKSGIGRDEDIILFDHDENDDYVVEESYAQVEITSFLGKSLSKSSAGQKRNFEETYSSDQTPKQRQPQKSSYMSANVGKLTSDVMKPKKKKKRNKKVRS